MRWHEFPISDGGVVPWGMVKPHAQRIAADHHGKSLAVVAQEGGMTASHVACVLLGYAKLPMDEWTARQHISRLTKAYLDLLCLREDSAPSDTQAA